MYSLDGADGMLYFNTMNRNANIAFHIKINSRYMNELNTNTFPESEIARTYFYTLLIMACIRSRQKSAHKTPMSERNRWSDFS